MPGLTNFAKKSVFLLSLLFAMQVHARTITLQQAVQDALKHSPTIRMAMHNVRAATYAAKAALMDMLPKVTISANYYRMGPLPTFNFSVMPSNPGSIPPQCAQTVACLANLMQGMDTSAKVGEANNFTFNTQVVQPLTPLISLYHIKAMKDIEGRAAVIDRQSAQETVKLNVKTVYFGLLQMQRTQEALKGTLNALKQHLKQVGAFVSAGMANQVDALRVRVRVSQIRSSIAQLKGQYQAALAAFNAMLGLPRDEDTQLEEPPHQVPALKPVAFYRKEALSHRLELSGMRRRLEEARQGLSLAKSAFIPQGSVFARYGYQYGNDFMPDWSWQVGVGLQWQWEWWKKGYLMDQARARLDQMQQGLEALKRGVLAQVDQAYYNVRALRDKLAYWQISVKQAQDAFRLTEARYKAGVATNTDVLDAQSALIAAKASYFAARYGLMMAAATLHEAVYGAIGGTGGSGAATQGQGGSTGGMEGEGTGEARQSPSRSTSSQGTTGAGNMTGSPGGM